MLLCGINHSESWVDGVPLHRRGVELAGRIIARALQLSALISGSAGVAVDAGPTIVGILHTFFLVPGFDSAVASGKAERLKSTTLCPPVRGQIKYTPHDFVELAFGVTFLHWSPKRWCRTSHE